MPGFRRLRFGVPSVFSDIRKTVNTNRFCAVLPNATKEFQLERASVAVHAKRDDLLPCLLGDRWVGQHELSLRHCPPELQTCTFCLSEGQRACQHPFPNKDTGCCATADKKPAHTDVMCIVTSKPAVYCHRCRRRRPTIKGTQYVVQRNQQTSPAHAIAEQDDERGTQREKSSPAKPATHMPLPEKTTSAASDRQQLSFCSTPAEMPSILA